MFWGIWLRLSGTVAPKGGLDGRGGGVTEFTDVVQWDSPDGSGDEDTVDEVVSIEKDDDDEVKSAGENEEDMSK